MRLVQLVTGYSPQRGGMETVAALLAREFAGLGHESVVLTRTPGTTADPGPVRVIRNPSPAVSWRVISRADRVILHGTPVRLAWPLAVLRRRGVIVQHMWDRPDASWLHRRITGRLNAACVSQYMQSVHRGTTALLPNPYDHELFVDRGRARDHELLFVGRVTRDKGVWEFISLCEVLARTERPLRATLVGNGPELPAVRAAIDERRLGDVIRVVGELAPAETANEMARHQILVVPALWDEPFGIVALEAIACGTIVAGYASGGIPEAVGPCGLLVPTGDCAALAQGVRSLLHEPAKRASLRQARESHLAKHRADAVARTYLDFLECIDAHA